MRFVILHHRLSEGEHWDLMLEQGDVLLTWQLARPPVGPEVLPISARRIQDHRKEYLEYEGPIRGDRGFVRRFDGGRLCKLRWSDQSCRAELAGVRLHGTFVLRRIGEQWEFDLARESDR